MKEQNTLASWADIILNKERPTQPHIAKHSVEELLDVIAKLCDSRYATTSNGVIYIQQCVYCGEPLETGCRENCVFKKAEEMLKV
jgi:hypothetical protein